MRFLARTILLLLAAAVPARAQDNAKLQKRVDELCKDVTDTLGIPFKNKVQAAYQSKEDFAAFVEKNIETEMPKEKRDQLTLTYRLLNLVPERFDLKESFTNLIKTQAGAYYDPETKRMYVLKSDLPDMFLDPMIFHELVHALQDQEHDLGREMKRLNEAGNDDAAQAYGFLVEGEAMFWMTVYGVEARGMKWDEVPLFAKNIILEKMKNSSTKSLREAAEASARLIPSMKEAAEGIKEVPPIFIRQLMDRYMRGCYASAKVYEKQGRDRFRQLFRSPPNNTRDMMFGDDWLKEPDRGSVPVKLDGVGAALGEEWTRVYDDTLGALTLHTLFEDKGPTADKIAKGWDGDRLQTWRRGADEALVAGRVVFHTGEAADTFAKQLEALYREQWTKGKLEEHKAEFTHLSDGPDRLLIQLKAPQVAFARGRVPAAAVGKLLDALWAGAAQPAKKP
jgi:hypothetical protein